MKFHKWKLLKSCWQKMAVGWDRDSKVISEIWPLWVYPYSRDDLTPMHLQKALNKLSSFQNIRQHITLGGKWWENSEGTGKGLWRCDDLNKHVIHRFISDYHIFRWGNCLRRMRKSGVVGGVCHWGQVFRHQKNHSNPSITLSA